MSEGRRGSQVAGGPLSGIRVIEIASEAAAYAGKMLADFGAEVLLVEPPGGHRTRSYGPFAEALPGDHPDRSLWFWHYNTSKLGLELDIDDPAGAESFRQLVAHADIVIEAEPIGRLAQLGLDFRNLRSGAGSPNASVSNKLVWVSVTSFGREDPRSADPYADLTVVAGGGIAWNNGYDDHTLPPMSCLGNQGYQTASVWAAIGALVALRARSKSGEAQLVDVSMHAAANVTTEQATQWWLVAGRVVKRQTGRHASHFPTESTVRGDRDGVEVHTGFPPRHAHELEALVRWIDDLDLRDEFPLTALLEMAIEQGGIDLAKLHEDEFTQECYRAGREAIGLIASKLPSYDFFVEGQTRGFAVGMIAAPDEILADPHIFERGYPASVLQPQLGREVSHVGLPIRFVGTPGKISAAPALGQHNHLFEQRKKGAPS
jgi:crotonobetainyl-CoA:carnitine CoA-transferase CaiB-like acyl-CoA transferase